MSVTDLIPRDQIQTYLRKRTGTLVSKQRITRWVNAGELRTVRIPRRCKWCKPGLYISRQSLETLISRYSA